MTLVLKCGSSFIEDPKDNFSYFFTYVILFLIPFMLFAMISRLNLSIKYFDQLEIIPVYQSSIILLNVLVGGVMFNEFQYLTWSKFAWFSVGAALCIAGTLVVLEKYSLSKQTQSSHLRTTDEIMGRDKQRENLLAERSLN